MHVVIYIGIRQQYYIADIYPSLRKALRSRWISEDTVRVKQQSVTEPTSKDAIEAVFS